MMLSGITIIEPAPTDIGLIIIIIIGIYTNKLKYDKKVITMVLLLSIILIANIISFFKVENMSIALRYILITFYLIMSTLFYIGFVGEYKMDGVKVLLSGYTFAATASAVIGILAYFSVLPYSEIFLKYGRISGFFKDPNVFGPFMIPIIIYSLCCMDNKNKKINYIMIFSITSVGVLLSFSRAAWGCYLAAIVSYYGLKLIGRKEYKIVLKFLLLIMVIGIGTYYIISIPQIKDMFEHRFAMQHYDVERFAKQAQAFQLIKLNPFGIGPGHTELVLDYASHNGYLRVWLENGFIGIIAFLAIIMISLIKCINKAIKSGTEIYFVAASSIIALVINGFVIDVIHWRHFWFILSIPWWNINTTYARATNYKFEDKQKMI